MYIPVYIYFIVVVLNRLKYFVKTPIDIVIYDRLPLCIIDTGNCVPGKRENNDGSHTRGRNFMVNLFHDIFYSENEYVIVVQYKCPSCFNWQNKGRRGRGRDHMVVGFTTKYEISAYYH